MKLKRVALAIGAMAMSSLAVDAQSATGTANAKVVTPISIAAVDTLEFGNILAGAGGTVAIAANGTPTLTTVTRPGTQSGTVRAASFTVTGEATFTYAITLPADSVVTLSDGASHTMAVDSFVSSPTVAAGGTIGGGGTQTLSVGATLTVGASQTAGTYQGTYDVTVAYN